MFNRQRDLRITYWVVLLGIATLFGWAGLQKAIHLDAFSLAVYRYHLLPEAVINVVALWVVGLELLCALLLFVPAFRLASLWVLFIMLLFFTFGIGLNLARNVQTSCGCFSTSPMAHSLGVVGIIKNLALMCLLLFLLIQERKKAGA